MGAAKLKGFLDSFGIKYVSIRHSPAFTAAEVAASSHLPAECFAKTIVVEISGGLAFVVLPADRRIVLADLRDLFADHDVKLVSEDELAKRFPDCERGAMPPVGNLYGLPVYIAQSLAGEPEIAFNACSHHEVIKMAFADFDRLVKPHVLDFATI